MDPVWHLLRARSSVLTFFALRTGPPQGLWWIWVSVRSSISSQHTVYNIFDTLPQLVDKINGIMARPRLYLTQVWMLQWLTLAAAVTCTSHSLFYPSGMHCQSTELVCIYVSSWCFDLLFIWTACKVTTDKPMTGTYKACCRQFLSLTFAAQIQVIIGQMVLNICFLVRLDLRYTFSRMHWSAEPDNMPGSWRHCGTVCSHAGLC